MYVFVCVYIYIYATTKKAVIAFLLGQMFQADW